MPKGRKTIQVERVLEMANKMLEAESDKFVYGNSEEYRQGVMTLLEQVLHETGNYHGFGYLFQRDLPQGSKPGIREGADYEEQFADTDRTRVRYF